MRVLIAEDDPVLLLILQTALQQAGHDCITAEDGLHAWELVQTAPVDVMISDWMMPGLEGIELCRRIRAAPRAHYMYLILVTGRGEKAEVRAAMEAGADDYLLKPLDHDELLLRLLVAERITTLHTELADKTREFEQVNQRLAEQGRTDALTSVGNRLRLHEDLQLLESRAKRYGQRCCAAMCDIDFFKRYNDTHGHAAGDEVLRRVAEAIRNAARVEDAVYRYGGEEFLVILPEQSLATAAIALDRIRSAVEALAIPRNSAVGDGVVTISAGVAALPTGADGDAVKGMLEAADAALYRAKAAGRNNVHVAEGELSKRFRDSSGGCP